ncbi:MAG: DnaD domain protein [Syntrophomonadaceae bacterium]
MQQMTASLELFRWGYAHLPGAVFFYAKELDLDMEDIGILTAIFYAYENTKPLFQSGVQTGQVLLRCSSLTTSKLSRRLQKLTKQGLLEVHEGATKSFTDKMIWLEPLMLKLEQLVVRDHPQIAPIHTIRPSEKQPDQQLAAYRDRIDELERELEEERAAAVAMPLVPLDANYRRVADFIAKKTGNLLSVKMEAEMRKWLTDFGFTPEFLFGMLEMAFERKITNPREITRIAKDLRDYAVTSVDGLDVYFKTYVDQEKAPPRVHFDPDAAEFGTYTGLDMSAEARRKVYHKWRYDWGFSHPMIMKAGELMCQRTKNGSLEYIDSVLNNWMAKEIRTLSDVDKEISEHKNRARTAKTAAAGNLTAPGKNGKGEIEFYVPPEVLAELKRKV